MNQEMSPKSGGNKKGTVFIIILIIILAGWWIVKGQTDKDDTIEGNDVMMNEENEWVIEDLNDTTVEDEGVMSEVKTFTLTAKNFEYSQKEIRVKKGDKVKIIMQIEQGFHDWVIDEFNAKTAQIGSGEAEVEFVADQVGTFEYYCSVGQHRANGMVGNLIVE